MLYIGSNSRLDSHSWYPPSLPSHLRQQLWGFQFSSLVFLLRQVFLGTVIAQIGGTSITKDLLFLLQIVTAFGFPYDKKYSSTYRSIWAFFPPNLLAEGLQLLADATSTPGDHGISWSGRTKCFAYDDKDCLISIVCSELQLIIVNFLFIFFSLLMCCIYVCKRGKYLLFLITCLLFLVFLSLTEWYL